MPASKQDKVGKTPDSATECGHKCRDKSSCKHLCCKRHLSPIVQLKSAERLSQVASSGPEECKHACGNKATCGHQCCKRHFTQQQLACGRKQLSSTSPQIVTQVHRVGQQHASASNLQQVRRASYGPHLDVQGKAMSKAEAGPQARSSDATPSFHFFIYDIESTGLSPAGDRIVEIAMKDSASPLEYATLVSCAPATVHWGAYKTHGISTKQSHEHGLPFKEVATQLLQFVKNCSTAKETPVLVAHNGRIFDNRMLTAEFKRSGSSLPSNWLWLDTLPLARQLLQDIKTHSQADLRQYLRIPPPLVAHRAAADVAILDQIVKGLAKEAGLSSLQGLMALEGPHKGPFADFAGITLKEEQQAKAHA